MMTNPLYNSLFLDDVLSQPEALRGAVRRFDSDSLQLAIQAFQAGEFDRVVITGMGTSYYGTYPAWLHLSSTGTPCLWVDTAELIHYASQQISARTLLWVVSQSGKSAEVIRLLGQLEKKPPAILLATTNEPSSPLAQSASLVIPLNAAPEQTVSTRTYLNTLALTQLAALHLCGVPIEPHLKDLETTAQALADYLEDWQQHEAAIDQAIWLPKHLLLLGRGVSLASAQTGALILQEAAKVPAFALQAAQFRHGPLEICGSDLTVIFFGGAQKTRALNRGLMEELLGFGVPAFWLGLQEGVQLPSLPSPDAPGIGLPLAEILPMQLLCLSLARRIGIEIGKFLYCGKVTTRE
jgi:glucosamine--fructose-6-phosphate aminotransferase (isomerizing)